MFLFIKFKLSILRRLPQTIPGQKPVLHEIQPDLHPLEVLYDVSKLLDEQNVELLSILDPGESHSDVSLSGSTSDCSLQ
jgi:hypothetical protein